MQDIALAVKIYHNSLAMGLGEKLDGFPKRIFSGKAHPRAGTKAVFFCFSLPGQTGSVRNAAQQGLFQSTWKDEAGETKWYLYDVERGTIAEDPPTIAPVIAATEATARRLDLPPATLGEIRAKVEKHIKNTVLRSLQAPLGVKPVLKAWMELN